MLRGHRFAAGLGALLGVVHWLLAAVMLMVASIVGLAGAATRVLRYALVMLTASGAGDRGGAAGAPTLAGANDVWLATWRPVLVLDPSRAAV